MLAGYITADRVHLAQVRRHSEGMRLVGRMTYVNQEFPDLESIIQAYIKKTEIKAEFACFGIAGTVIGSEVVQGSFPWQVSYKSVKKEFAFTRVILVNDVVATAKGIFELPNDKFYTIKQGFTDQTGNIGLLAAGSGLGEALICYDGEKYSAIASEGGHSGFAPMTQLEADLWEFLYSETTEVEVEDVVSLRGLTNIYRFLSYRAKVDEGKWYVQAADKPAAIIEKGLAGSDEIAVKTLEVFTDCYASEAANLAVKGITVGGVYLGGMIAPRLVTAFDRQRFADRFVRRGRMAAVLSGMPVTVIMDETAALLGAGCTVLGL